MPEIAHSAAAMISGMEPQLREGSFVFVSLNAGQDTNDLHHAAIASFREEEGLSLILPFDVAADAGFDTAQPMACITLNVYSALSGVGLTAAVSGALGASDIPCNIVAAYHHDHVFVPWDAKDRALTALQTLQSSATS
ncbi:ACT domain-containing protein [Thalassovita sp.]|uniref:ACT domain-containing protein n=1 Tax=Thalassovita sp. TaxID=1979401 RepID=UPI002AB0850E|nr:ACT domain-containing protein [Thalassovita sp.]